MTYSTIQAAGFIIADDAAIWGAGVTEDAAWADLRNGMKLARVPHDSEVDMEDTYRPRSWSEDRFTVIPATAALLARVEECGGAISYGMVGDIACTTDEEDAALDA
jgi:hypothetical protein